VQRGGDNQMTVTRGFPAARQLRTGSRTATQPENSAGEDDALLFNDEGQPALGSISGSLRDPSQ